MYPGNPTIMKKGFPEAPKRRFDEEQTNAMYKTKDAGRNNCNREHALINYKWRYPGNATIMIPISPPDAPKDGEIRNKW